MTTEGNQVTLAADVTLAGPNPSQTTTYSPCISDPGTTVENIEEKTALANRMQNTDIG